MAKPTIESASVRYKRYIRARDKMDLHRTVLEDAYDLTIPNRANFEDWSEGEQRNLEIFDNTAQLSVLQFSNDVQSILLPPYQKWAKLIPGFNAPQNDDTYKLFLEQVTDMFFNYIEQSNFYQTSAVSLQDAAISTGIMIVEEGPDDNPLIFRSVPISEVAFEEGRNEKLQNFWRCFEVSLRDAMLMWPGLRLTQQMQTQIESDPDEKVKLIEGTVLLPGKEEIDDKFLYYIQTENGTEDLLQEVRDWNPWIAFRLAKKTGEALGYGPVLSILPTIRALNKMSEWMLRAFKFNALGIYMVENAGIQNPFTTILEPGATINIEPTSSGKDPIRPIQQSGQPQISFEIIQSYQQVVKDRMQSNPLPDPPKSGVSATEISIRQENWVRQNAAAFGRLTVELLEPIIVTSLKILQKKGIIKLVNPEAFKIDRKIIDIKYESPLIAIQDQQDVQDFQNAVGIIQSAFGQQGLVVAYDMKKANKYINEKLNIPISIVNSESQMDSMISNLQQAQQQSVQQLGPGQVEEPQLPLAQ